MSENTKPKQNDVQAKQEDKEKDKKRTARIILLILSILFFLGAIITPIIIFTRPRKNNYTEETYGDFIYRYDVQAKVYDIVRYIGDDTVVTVPNTHNDKPVRAILPNAFDADKRDFDKQITKVTIQEGVESIGASVFNGCESLVDLEIPASVEQVGNRAFAGTGLKQLNIKDASVLKFANGALEGADYLTKLVIEGASSPLTTGTLGSVSDNVTDLEVQQGVDVGYGSFDNLDSITNLTVYNYSNLVVDRNALANTNITTLTIYHVENTLTEDFMNKFNALSATLRNIVLDSKIDTIGPKSFISFTALATLTMGDGTAIDVSAISSTRSNRFKIYMVSDNENEQTLKINNESGSVSFNTLKKEFADLFEYEKITKLYISENFTAIDDRAFQSYTNLKYLDFGENSKVTAIGSKAFGENDSVQSLDVVGPLAVTPYSGKEETIVYKTFNYVRGAYSLRHTYNGSAELGSVIVAVNFYTDEGPTQGEIDSSYLEYATVGAEVPLGYKIIDYLPQDYPGHRIARGYSLEGYYMPDGTKIENQVMEKGMEQNLVITTKWKKGENIEYTIQYYIEKLEQSDQYELYTTKTGLEPVKTKVDMKNNHDEITGFTFDPDVAGSITEIVIVAEPREGENLLKLYYKRNTYKVRFDLGYDQSVSVTMPKFTEDVIAGHQIQNDDDGYYINFKYGADINSLPVPTRSGYDFKGWFTSTGEQVSANDNYKISGELTLQANWQALEVDYVLDYYFEVLNYTGEGEKYLPEGLSHKITGKAYADSIFNYTVQTVPGFTYNDQESNIGTRVNGDGTTVIKICFDRNVYNVNFDVNDLTGSTRAAATEGSSLSPVSLKFGQQYTLPQLTRLGYDFVEWNTKADGHGTKVEVNSAVDVSNVGVESLNVTLYAIWKAKTYNVIYNKNNNDATGEMQNSTLTFDAAGSLSQNGYQLVGYHFGAWSNVENYAEGAERYTDQATIAITGENYEKFVKDDVINLYVVWDANTYTVTYYAGEEGGVTGSTTASNMIYGVKAKLNINGFAKIGYHFTGWKIKTSEGTFEERLYADQEEVENLTAENNGNVDMYAQWEVNTYTIVFDPNSNGEVSGSMESIEATYGQPVTIGENKFEFTGHELVGWAREDNKNVAIYTYTDGDSITINSALTDKHEDTVTLYAVWKAYQYTVNIYQNTSKEDPTFHTLTWIYGQSTLTNTYTNPGYYCQGWATTREEPSEILATAAELNNWLLQHAEKNGSQDLYTIWGTESSTKYTVEVYFEELGEGKQTYYKNEADLSEVKEGTTGENVTFTKADVEANGEWKAKLGGFEYDVEKTGADENTGATGVVNGNGSTVLKIYYKRMRVTVAYDYNIKKGDYNVVTPEHLNSFVAIYEAPYLLEEFPTLERYGYKHIGWATDAEGTHPVRADEDYTDTSVDKLYAMWTVDVIEYKVEYLLQNLTRDGYDIYSAYSETLTAATDSLVTIEPQLINGFTLVSDTQDYQQVKNVPGTVITLKYDRNQMIITFYNGEDEFGEKVDDYYYGQTADISGVTTPTKDYFSFTFWSDRESKAQMPERFVIEKNYELEANFEANKYTVIIRPNADGATIDSTLSQQYQFIDGQIVITYTDSIDLTNIAKFLSRTGYTVLGFDFESSKVGEPIYKVLGTESLLKLGSELLTAKGVESPYASCAIELFAYWQTNKHAITYTFNGQTVEHEVDGQQEFAFDTSVNLYTAEQVEFVNNGFTLIKWQRKDHDDETFDLGQQIQMPDYTLELVPVWQAVRFTVKYDSNKPETTLGQVSGQVAETFLTYDTAGNLAVNNYSLVGYTFKGWSTDKTSGENAYASEKRLSQEEVNLLYTHAENGTVTLYAIWEAITYSVDVYANFPNAQLLEKTQKVTLQLTYDQEYTLNDGEEAFKRNGYTLKGWATSQENADANQIAYTIGSTIKNLATEKGEIVKIYCVWDAESGTSYFVVRYFQTVEGGDHYETKGDPEQYHGETGAEVTAPMTTVKGFEFDEEKTANQNKGTISANGDTELKVYYKRLTYTLHFELNEAGKTGHSSGDHADIEDIIFEGSVGKLPTVTKNGYDFVGWFTSTTGGTQVDDNSNFLTEWADSYPQVTLYAHWTASESQYTVYYMLQQLDGNYEADDAEEHPHTETKRGTTDTLVNFDELKAKTFDGFTYASTKASNNGIIYGEGTGKATEVWVYYTRDTYTLTIVRTDGFQSLEIVIDDFKGQHDGNVYYGVAFDAKITITHTLAEGFDLDGFYYGDETKVDGDNFKMPNANTTLNAKANPYIYNVTFDANGGQQVGETITKTVKFNETLEAPSEKDFTKEGYTLDGFAVSVEKALANDIIVLPTRVVNMSDVARATENVKDLDITLYAVWKAVNYQVTFDANYQGGQNSIVTFTMGEENTLPSKDQVTRRGYTLVGWDTDEGKTDSPTYTEGLTVNDQLYSQYVAGENSLTLYAVWKANVYQVTFDANYDGGESQKQNKQFTYDGTNTMLEQEFTRTGYNFLGWSKNSSSTSAEWTKGESVGNALSDDGKNPVTVYAIWEAHRFVVTYNGNKSDAGTMISSTFAYGRDNTLKTSTYTRSGYTFGGWSRTADGLKDFEPGANTYNQLYEANESGDNGKPVTLYAYWIADHGISYTIQHYVRDLAGPTENALGTGYTKFRDEALTGDTGTEVDALTESQFYTTNGFTKLGYIYDAEKTADSHKGRITADGKLVLTIYYTRSQFNVTYNDGQGNDYSSQTQYYVGVLLTLKTIEAIRGEQGGFTKDGYTFKQWSYGDGATVKDGGQVKMPAEELVLTAQWDENSYTFVFDNGEGEGSCDPLTGTYTGSITLPDAGNFTRTGYHIDGWSIRQGEEKKYDLQASVNVEEIVKELLKSPYDNKSSITLYAHYAPNEGTHYTIKHYRQSLKGDYPEDLVVTESGSGTTGELATATPKDSTDEFLGFTYSAEAEGEVKSETITPNGDLVLKLYYTRNTYELTVDKENGVKNVTVTGGELKADSSNIYTVKFEEKVTLVAELSEGYKFDDWYKDGEKLNKAATYVIDKFGAEALTLTAKATAIEFTVKLNENGGSLIEGKTDTDKSVTLTYDSTGKLEAIFELAGHDFKGYAISNLASDGKYKDELTKEQVNELFKEVRSGEVTLYAIWSVHAYTLTLDQNGGQGGDESKTVNYNTVLPNIKVPTKTGYTFKGYFLDNVQYYNANGTPCEREDGGNKYTATTDIELKAEWEARNDIKYTIEYKLKKYNEEDYDVEQDIKYDGTADQDKTVTAKKFNGFYVADDQTEKTQKIEADGTTKFIFTYERQTANITFEMNEPTEEDKEGEAPKDHKGVVYGDPTVLNQNTLSVRGKKVEYWLLNGERIDLDATVSKVIEEASKVDEDNTHELDIVLEAFWADGNAEVTLRFYIQKLDEKGEPLSSGTTDDDKQYYTLKEVKKVVDAHTKLELTQVILEAYVPGSTVDKDYTIENFDPDTTRTIDIFTKLITHTATFKDSDGTEVHDSKTIYYGATLAQVLKDIEANKKAGYVFVEWLKGGQSVVNEETVKLADVEFTVRWRPINYTVKFVSGYDGQVETKGQTEISTNYDGSITIPTATSMFTLTGRTLTKFTYGNESKDAALESVIKVKDIAEAYEMTDASNDEGELVLNAVWVINQFTVTYHFNNSNEGLEVDNVDKNDDQKLAYDPDATNKYTFKNADTYTITGLVLSGWKLEATSPNLKYAAGTQVDVNELIADAGVTNNNEATIHLYAHWTSDKYSVTVKTRFDNGKEVVDGVTAYLTQINDQPTENVTNKTVEYATYNYAEKTYTVNTITLTYTTKDGYTFKGWYVGESQQTEGVVSNAITLNMAAEEKIYEASFEAKEVTLTLSATEADKSSKDWDNLNGFTGSEEKTATKQVKFDTTITEGQSLPTPTRAGYSFVGWYSDPTRGEPIDHDTVWSFTEGKTYYARWTANQYTIKFVKGDEDTTGDEVVRDNVKFSDTFMTPALSSFTKTGYTLIGFSLTKGAEEKDYDLNKQYNVKDLATKAEKTEANQGVIEITLYSVFRVNTYTVVFETNGGKFDGSSDSKTEYNVAYTSTKKISEVVGEPTREGYDFANFYLQEGHEPYGLDHELGGLTEQDGVTVTLTASWTKHSGYTLTVVVDESGHGKAYIGDKDSETTKSSLSFEDRFTVHAVADGGYHFEGWYVVTEEGDQKLESAGANYTSTMPALETNDSTYTLKAKFEINSYKVEVVTVTRINGVKQQENKQEASIEGENVEGYYKFNTPLTLNAPEVAGYTVKWFKDEDFAQSIGSDSYTIEDTLDDRATLTLYAVYDAIKYKVKLDENGGNLDLADMAVNPFEAYYDTKYDLKNIVSSITRNGYEFAGWQFGEKTYKDDDTLIENLTTTADQVVTLTAQWTSYEYQVSFEAGEGADGTVSETTIKYEDESVTLSADGFTKTGYTFAGWALKDHDEIIIKAEEITLSGAQFAVKAKIPAPYKSTNITLVAIWAANKVVVKLSAPDADNEPADWTGLDQYGFVAGEDKTATKTYNYDDQYGKLPTPSRKGYIFQGWYLLEADAIQSGDKVHGEGEVTLTAHWTEGQYNVTVINYYKDASGRLVSGSVGGSASADKSQATYTKDQVTLTAEAASGYHFVGYYKNEACEEAYFEEGNNLTSKQFDMEPNDVRIYALFEIDTYTVEIKEMFRSAQDAAHLSDPTEGTTGGTATGDGEAKFNTEVSLSASNAEHYVFVGWFTDQACKSPADAVKEGNILTMPACENDGDTYTIYALFVIERVAVSVESYHRNAGDIAGELADITKDDPSKATLPVVLKNNGANDEETSEAGQTSGYILYGTTITVTAPEEEHTVITYHTAETCTEENKVDDGVISDTVKNLYVLYTAQMFTVNVQVYTQTATSYNSLGELTLDEEFIGGTVTGNEDTYYGQTRKLTATANEHYMFDGWYTNAECTSQYEGEDDYKSEIINVQVTAAVSLFAKFVQKQYNVKIHAMYTKITDLDNVEKTPVEGTEGGTVALPDEDGEEHKYYANQSITLTTSAVDGYLFTGWFTNQACTTDVKSENTFTLTGDLELWGLFTAQKYKVDVTTKYQSAKSTSELNEEATGTDGGTVSGAGSYYFGQSLTLTANPAEGFELEGWYDAEGNKLDADAGATGNTYQFTTETKEKSVTAKFVQSKVKITVVTATRTASGNEVGEWKYSDNEEEKTEALKGGLGFIQSFVIDGTSKIHDGGKVYEAEVYYGKNLNLNATANAGYTFAGWFNSKPIGDSTTHKNNSYTISNYRTETTVYAAFDQSQVTITLAGKVKTAKSATELNTAIDDADGTYGTLTGTDSYFYGFSATLKAVAKTGYKFVGWFTDTDCQTPLDGVENTSDEVQYTVTKTETIYALFEAERYQVTIVVRLKDGPDSATKEDLIGEAPSGNRAYLKTSFSDATGEDVQEDQAQGYVYYNAKVNIGNQPRAQKDYKFNGLYKDQDGNSLVTLDNGAYLVTETVTLYAIFELNAFDVTVTSMYRSASSVNTLGEAAEGGTGGGVSDTTDNYQGTVTYSISVNSQLTLHAKANDGYIFKGWYSSSACAGDALETSETYTTTILGATQIYARFDQKAYEIEVVAMGDSLVENEHQDKFNESVGGEVSIKEIKWTDEGNTGYFVGYAITLVATAKIGYRFVGWYKNFAADNSFTDGIDGNSYNIDSKVAENNKLYAKFEMKTYTLELKVRYSKANDIHGYDSALLDGDSSIGTLTGDGVNYYYGQTVTINAVAGTGYVFIGWYGDEECSTKEIKLEESAEITINQDSPAYVSDESLVAYAKFIPSELTYKATVRGQDATSAHELGEIKDATGGNITIDGEGHEETPTNGKIYYGQEITFVATALDGYTFEGWFSDEGLGVESKLTQGVVENKITLTATEAIDVYAKFIPARYKLTYGAYYRDSNDADPQKAADNKGGTVAIEPEAYDEAGYFAGFEVKLTASAVAGYTFIGWYTDQEFNSNAVSGDASYTHEKLASDEELYALFALNSYQVNGVAYFQNAASATSYNDPKQAATGGTVTGVQSVSHGGSAKLTANPAEGYEFIGWYTTASFDGAKISTNGDYVVDDANKSLTISNITESVTVYGLFVIKKVHVSIEVRSYSATDAANLNSVYDVLGGTAYFSDVFVNGTALDTSKTEGQATEGYILYGQAPELTYSANDDYDFTEFKLQTGSEEVKYEQGTTLTADQNSIYAYFTQKLHTLKVVVYYKTAASSTTLNNAQEGTLKGTATLNNDGFYKGKNVLEFITTTPNSSEFAGFYLTTGFDEKIETYEVKGTTDETIYALFIPTKFAVTLHTATKAATSSTTIAENATIDTDDGGTLSFGQDMFANKDGSETVTSTDCVKGTTYYAYDGSTVTANYTENSGEGFEADQWYSNEGLTNKLGKSLSVKTNTTAYILFTTRQISLNVKAFKADAVSPTQLGKVEDATDAAGKVTGNENSKYYYGFEVVLTASSGEGYTFKGWFTSEANAKDLDQDPTAVTNTYTVSTRVTQTSVTVYALFITKTYRITLHQPTAAQVGSIISEVTWTNNQGWTTEGTTIYRDFYATEVGTIDLPTFTCTVKGSLNGNSFNKKVTVTRWANSEEYFESKTGDLVPPDIETSIPEYAAESSFAALNLYVAEIEISVNRTVKYVTPDIAQLFEEDKNWSDLLTTSSNISYNDDFAELSTSQKEIKKAGDADTVDYTVEARSGFVPYALAVVAGDKLVSGILLSNLASTGNVNINSLFENLTRTDTSLFVIYWHPVAEVTLRTYSSKNDKYTLSDATKYTYSITANDSKTEKTVTKVFTSTTALGGTINNGIDITQNSVVLHALADVSYTITVTPVDENYEVVGYNKNSTVVPTAEPTIKGNSLTTTFCTFNGNLSSTATSITPTAGENNVQILSAGKEVQVVIDQNNTSLTATAPEKVRIDSTMTVTLKEGQYETRYKNYQGLAKVGTAQVADYLRNSTAGNASLSIPVTAEMVAEGKVTLYIIQTDVKVWVDAYNAESAGTSVTTFTPAYDTLDAAVKAVNSTSGVLRADIIIVADATLSTTITPTKVVTITGKTYKDNEWSDNKESLPKLTVSEKAGFVPGSKAFELSGLRIEGSGNLTGTSFIATDNSATKSFKDLYINNVNAASIFYLQGTGAVTLSGVEFTNCTAGENNFLYASSGTGLTLTLTNVKIDGTNTITGQSAISLGQHVTATANGLTIGSAEQELTVNSDDFYALVQVTNATLEVTNGNLYGGDQRDFYVEGDSASVTWNGEEMA